MPMSRSTQTLSILSRAAIRKRPLTRSQHSLLRQQGPATIQHVRFRQPGLRYGRITRFAAQFALTGYLFYLINQYVLGYDDEEDGEASEAEPNAPIIAVAAKTLQGAAEGPAEEQMEELVVQLPDRLPEDAIFIPLWWGKKRAPTFYKGSDPEWQGFVKFAQDKKRIKAVRASLAAHIQDVAGKNPHWTNFLGAPVQLTRFWLDFDFPLGPPPEYDRPGIEIADDYVAITTRPQSQEHYKRVKSALWPDAITKSFAASFWMYWSLQYSRVKGYLNVKTEADAPRTQTSPDPFNLHKISKNTDKQGPQIGAGMEKLSDPKAGGGKAPGPTPTDVNPPKQSTSGVSSDSAKILSFLPPLKKAEGDLGSAVAAFKRTLLQTWQPPAIVDRGAFAISGFVEVAGSKAKILVDVMGTFHPEKNELKVLHVRPRRAQPNRLIPRG